ncbi:MAG: CDC27 family protein [Candidatus Gracilibacteria bacterium]
MENLILLRIELLLFISSLSYSIYYGFSYIYNIFNKIKNIVSSPINKSEVKNVHVININKETHKTNLQKNSLNSINLSEEEKLKIVEILKRIKVNIEKGYYDKAKILIIEGLTIDKYNKDLNMELGFIYEQENNFKNAELIYKDISMIIQDNTAILIKLGYVLSMQGSLDEAIVVYEKVQAKKQSDNEVIETLAHLTYEVQDFEKALKYIKLVLKEKPKNLDMMKKKAFALERVGKLKDAIKMYEEILFIRPYDVNAIDNVKRLEQNIMNTSSNQN